MTVTQPTETTEQTPNTAAAAPETGEGALGPNWMLILICAITASQGRDLRTPRCCWSKPDERIIEVGEDALAVSRQAGDSLPQIGHRQGGERGHK